MELREDKQRMCFSSFQVWIFDNSSEHLNRFLQFVLSIPVNCLIVYIKEIIRINALDCFKVLLHFIVFLGEIVIQGSHHIECL